MDLMAVMTEVGLALAELDDVRVFVVGASAEVSVPGTGASALVAYPRRVAFDEAAYGRGMDTIEQEFMIVVPEPRKRTTAERVTAYAAGSGPKSVKAALDGYAWTACHGCRVEGVEFDTVEIKGVEYMSAVFTASLWGSGA